MTCEHSHEDGAYVLGILTPAERDAYEEHLSECEQCRDSVAELAGLPGRLGQVPREAAERLTTDAALPNSSLSRLLATAAERRRADSRRARWRTAAVAAVAACVVLAAWIGVWALTPPDLGRSRTPDAVGKSRPAMTAMTPVGGQTRVGAELSLSVVADGTLVRMRCWYITSREHAPGKRWHYALVAISRPGEVEQLASWSVGSSDQPRIRVTTRFSRAELERLEIRRLDGRAVLRYRL